MEEAYPAFVFCAIEMWVNTLIRLCDENHTNSHTNQYSYFITNVLNYNNPDREAQMKQAINDFYDYFYIHQHICDINDMRSLGDLDNNYGIYDTKLRLLDTLKKIEHNAQSTSVFKTITIYVFQLCCSVRTPLGLKIFDNVEKDKSIVQYFTRYDP